jgi:glycerol-3-phosphate dehydrogenase
MGCLTVKVEVVGGQAWRMAAAVVFHIRISITVHNLDPASAFPHAHERFRMRFKIFWAHSFYVGTTALRIDHIENFEISPLR